MLGIFAHYRQVMGTLLQATHSLHNVNGSRLAIGWVVDATRDMEFVPLRSVRMLTARAYTDRSKNRPTVQLDEYALPVSPRTGQLAISANTIVRSWELLPALKRERGPGPGLFHRAKILGTVLHMLDVLNAADSAAYSAPDYPLLYAVQNPRCPLQPELENRTLIELCQKHFGVLKPTHAQLRQTFGAHAIRLGRKTLYPLAFFTRGADSYDRCPLTGDSKPTHAPTPGFAFGRWMAHDGDWFPMMQQFDDVYADVSVLRGREFVNVACNVFERFKMLPSTPTEESVTADTMEAIKYQLQQLRTGAFELLKESNLLTCTDVTGVTDADVARINAFLSQWPAVEQQLCEQLACRVGRHVDGIDTYPQLGVTDAELLAGLRDPRMPIAVYGRMCETYLQLMEELNGVNARGSDSDDIDDALANPLLSAIVSSQFNSQLVAVPGLFEPETLTWRTEQAWIDLHIPTSITKPSAPACATRHGNTQDVAAV